MSLFRTIGDLKSDKFLAPLGVWDEFVKGHIWQDIKKELSCWLVDTWELLEDVDDPIEAARLRGRARLIREVMNLPDGIMEMIENQQGEET
jgi:hypothetical protein